MSQALIKNLSERLRGMQVVKKLVALFVHPLLLPAHATTFRDRRVLVALQTSEKVAITARTNLDLVAITVLAVVCAARM
jgi:hypothetical protein